MKRTLSWERLKAEGKRAGEDETVSSITDPMDTIMSKLQGIVEDRGVWGAAVHGATESLSD